MNRIQNSVIALCALFILLALPAVSFAQSALTDDADTKGTSASLNLAPGSNVYLRFKLTSTLPNNTAGSNVARATIKLYLGAVKAPGTVDVYLVSSNWSEQTIASAPPSLGGIVKAGVPIQLEQQEKFIVIEITSAVQQWLGTDGSGTGGAPNFGVALVAHDGVSVAIDSKENSQTSHEPQLSIQLNNQAGQQGPPGPQGDPGPQGPTGPQGPQGDQGSILDHRDRKAIQARPAQLGLKDQQDHKVRKERRGDRSNRRHGAPRSDRSTGSYKVSGSGWTTRTGRATRAEGT